MTLIKEYEKVAIKIAKQFSEKYSDGDFYFTADDVYGICSTGDLFLSVSDMYMVLRNNPTVDEFYEAWYYYLDTEGKECNLRNLIRFGVEEMKLVTKKGKK